MLQETTDMKTLIDNGKEFNWGKSSDDYAKFRDIYPEEMYELLRSLGFAEKGTKCLDTGTGTGVIPRFMYKYGGELYGADISDNQIIKARELSKGMNISYCVSSAEKLPFDDSSFDCVSAVQCWRYFDKEKTVPEIYRVLKPRGKLIIAYMQWLPEEDGIIKNSLELVKKYNPDWDCFGKRLEENDISVSEDYFKDKKYIEFDCFIPFTRESWNGRMIACRGIEPSLSKKEVDAFSEEHLEMLRKLTDGNFRLKHQITVFCFEKKQEDYYG